MSAAKRFGMNVRLARVEAGLSQAEMAQLAGLANQSSWSVIERGDRESSLNKMIAAASALGVPLARLIEGVEEAHRESEWKARKKLYVIMQEGADVVKIGVSRSPRERLHTLQTGSSSKLSLIGIGEDAGAESSIHEALMEHRVSGEWFSWTDPVREALDPHVEWCAA